MLKIAVLTLSFHSSCPGSRLCPVTGQELSGWVAMESNEKLRARIQGWAADQGLNMELLDTAAALLQQWRCASAADEEEEQVFAY